MLESINRVRDLAYLLWEEQGCPPGRQLEHWLEAERRLSGPVAPSAGPVQPKPQPKPKRARKASKGK